MNGITFILFAVILVGAAKGWRFFLETTDDFKAIRLLEPWFWFLFLNLVLSWVTGNYDYRFVLVGLLIQLALSAWFAISIGWIIQACPHKTGVLLQSLFVRGKTLKFCYRCGTRLPKETHAHLIKDNSWTYFLFQMPPHLLEYVVFWTAQSLMVLISLFFVLKFLRKPNLQQDALLAAVILVILAPPTIYFLGRFRKYLSDTKGLIWWGDLKNSFLVWTLVLFILWGLVQLSLR